MDFLKTFAVIALMLCFVFPFLIWLRVQSWLAALTH